ncbi:hypothetical protein PVAG01_01506 [Phlyctema vagabunda]|uniref:Uncharacterized protein n=1 Tax=Phlyctema vagabunda TaxID=108571 RepID=A0ABR4PXB8_9HELO
MAASNVRSSTPPPSAILQTPPTPKHGYEDDYNPFTPRKSPRTRYQQRRQERLAQTPPQQQQQRVRTERSSIAGSSPPTSPQTVTKKNAPRSSTIRGRSYVSNMESTYSASAHSTLSTSPRRSKKETEMQRSIMASHSDGMLPTPAKTPKKAPVEVSAGIASIARNLFPVRTETVEEAMPTPKRQARKKNLGFVLETSTAAEEDDAPIQIFTDSKERVPEIDCNNNPFYNEGNTIQPEPAKRITRSTKIAVPGEDDQDIDELRQRDDGMITVFRGKKTFRKFAESSDEDSDDGDLLGEFEAEFTSQSGSRINGPLTRSSIKPRLLFSNSAQQTRAKTRSQATEDEEEAVTDIDDDLDFATTSTGKADDAIMTPKAPRFAPASPPTTLRATRSTDKTSIALGGDDSSNGGRSPFNRWGRVKAATSIAGMKREGESLERSNGFSNKRSRF